MNPGLIAHIKNALWLILEWAIFLIIGGVLSIAVSLLFSSLIPGVEVFYTSDKMFEEPFLGALAAYLPLLVVSIVTIWIVHKLIFKRPWSILGFDWTGLTAQFARGGWMALVILFVGFILLLIAGQLLIERFDWNASLFVGFIFLFLIQSAVEEVIGRSYLIPAIETRFNTVVALITSSLIFSVVHGTNANVSYLGLINIFLAGLVMGLLFVRYRKLWAPLGFHAAWNFIQGSFLGYEVSGIDVYSYIDTKETGLDFITGGPFGFEGSILATMGLIACCVWIRRHLPEDALKRLPQIDVE